MDELQLDFDFIEPTIEQELDNLYIRFGNDLITVIKTKFNLVEEI